MCRKQMLLGFSLISGGAGLLLGLLIGSPFFSFILGAALILTGALLAFR